MCFESVSFTVPSFLHLSSINPQTAARPSSSYTTPPLVAREVKSKYQLKDQQIAVMGGGSLSRGLTPTRLQPQPAPPPPPNTL